MRQQRALFPTFPLRTGSLRFIGLTGHDDDGYAMSPDGVLYAIDAFLALYRVDTSSGASTMIRFNPPCYVSLAYGPYGFLYCTDPTNLWRLDPENGNAQSTGRSIIGLAFKRTPSRP